MIRWHLDWGDPESRDCVGQATVQFDGFGVSGNPPQPGPITGSVSNATHTSGSIAASTSEPQVGAKPGSGAPARVGRRCGLRSRGELQQAFQGLDDLQEAATRPEADVGGTVGGHTAPQCVDWRERHKT
jgi:hypothetical protein